MAKPRFVKDTDQLNFSRGLQFPLVKIMEKMQAIERSAGGDMHVEDLAPSRTRFPLKFKKIPEGDYNQLVNWFDTIANGAMVPFTFFDEDGRQYTIRIVSDKLNFPEVQHQRYSGELLVEMD